MMIVYAGRAGSGWRGGYRPDPIPWTIAVRFYEDGGWGFPIPQPSAREAYRYASRRARVLRLEEFQILAPGARLLGRFELK